MTKFDESRILKDKSGYNYVRVTPEEIINWGGYCVCNGCNNQYINEDQNLVFILGDVYCDRCFNEIKDRWHNYTDISKEDIEGDLGIQERESLEWYKYHLDKDYRNEVISAQYNSFYTDPDSLCDAMDELMSNGMFL